MADLRDNINELYTLEKLSAKGTFVHRLHPLAKLMATVCYLLCVMSLGRYEISWLAPFFFYPVIVMALAEIPFGMIGKRVLVALPFCLFAGVSNLLLERGIYGQVGNFVVTWGMLSFASILLRTLLCVAAILLLVAVTPFSALTAVLRRMHVPGILVSLLEMTYRYLGTLMEEASLMYTAYQLRSGMKKGLAMRDMGCFVGQLLLKSVQRAERIYQAMQCRGYGQLPDRYKHWPMRCKDWYFLLCVAAFSLLFRCINIPLALGRWFA